MEKAKNKINKYVAKIIDSEMRSEIGTEVMHITTNELSVGEIITRSGSHMTYCKMEIIEKA